MFALAKRSVAKNKTHFLIFYPLQKSFPDTMTTMYHGRERQFSLSLRLWIITTEQHELVIEIHRYLQRFMLARQCVNVLSHIRDAMT